VAPITNLLLSMVYLSYDSQKTVPQALPAEP
jgi:hypothetical protein